MQGCRNTDADKERSSTAWDEIIYDDLTSLDLSGKKVAFFGCGDSSSYGDYWCDSMGELHECFGSTGATVIGTFCCACKISYATWCMQVSSSAERCCVQAWSRRPTSRASMTIPRPSQATSSLAILSARTACPRRPMRGTLMRLYLPFCLPRLPSCRIHPDHSTWYRRIAAWVTHLVSEGAK